MLRKTLILACSAFLATLAMTSEAQAWGCYHYSYHYGRYGGGYRYGYHYGGSPYGGYHYGYHYGGYPYGGFHYGYYRRW